MPEVAVPDPMSLLQALRGAVRRSAGPAEAPARAAALLRVVAGVLPSAASVVLVGGRDAGHLLAAEPAAAAGIDWARELAPAGDVWVSSAPRRTDGTPGGSLVLPLDAGAGTFGLVVLRPEPASEPSAVSAAAATVTAYAAELETALLFDELRAAAATDERHRVAREVHDGMAQELATIGYRLDGLVSDAEPVAADLAAELRNLRRQLSGVVREVRHVIYDLRTGVEPASGLGAALADYARALDGTTVQVHLELAEATTRLPRETEAELLRIAQEAMTNARRHSGAANLWVTCRISPPAALLRVEDDGSGLPNSRGSDSFGIDIIRERAQRLGASLSLRERLPSGTLVEVLLGDPRSADASADTG